MCKILGNVAHPIAVFHISLSRNASSAGRQAATAVNYCEQLVSS
jgi:hypothetical protein